MPAAINALDSGNPDSDDEPRKQDRLAARAARFTQKLVGNRYKELEEARTQERKAFEQQGLIKVGKTELGDAVDLKGTCERMCSDYEREFREWTREVHPFERIPGQKSRIDPNKAVAAYSRSDAGAGHGDSAILPSDLRTPATLVRTLDYLFSEIMSAPPPGSTSPTPRRALGYSAGFIRDRTRAIRKEFAMQSSWGHAEAISSFERIARWHILCLRELQEETGSNADMHIDSAELGRCFTSLRQHYNDRREELGVEQPCPNEPEFRAYMLIFDLAQKSVSIPTAELPHAIVDHPLVKLAWEIRKAAQRNFDSQKEGSKLNSELGANNLTRFVKLLKQPRVPYLLSCLVEIRLREIRRSALRALIRTYPRLRDGQPIRTNDAGEVVERRMVLIKTLNTLLGCAEQEDEESAWDDVLPVSKDPDAEAFAIVRRFELEVYEDNSGPVGVLINNGVWFNDNKDAPYTRRWKSITAKRGSLPYSDIVNGKVGIQIEGAATVAVAPRPRPPVPVFNNLKPITAPSIYAPSKSVFSFDFSKPAPAPAPRPSPSAPEQASFSFIAEAGPSQKRRASPNAPALTATRTPFSFAPSQAPAAAPPPVPPFAVASPTPSFSFNVPKTPVPPPAPVETTTPKAPPPLFSKPSFFAAAEAGPSTSKPSTPPQSVKAPQPAPSPHIPGRLRTQSLVVSKSGRRPSSSLEDEWRKQKASVPILADELVNRVVEELLADLRPELAKHVQREAAARAYAARKVRRKEEIQRWSGWVADDLLGEVLRKITGEMLQKERKRRSKIVRDQEYSQKMEAMRQAEEKVGRERQEMMRRLKGMGLSHSPGLGMKDPVGLESSLRSRSIASDERMDEFESDVALLQAQRSRDHFFTPGTFLHIIARHVGPLLAPVTPSSTGLNKYNEPCEEIEFRTLVSIAQDAGAPASPEAEKWLVSKFLPEKDDRGFQFVERDGVYFETDVVDQWGGKPGGKDTGLLVFEAPPVTYDPVERAENLTDAHARIGGLEWLAGRTFMRYDPALLILTWEDETLAEVTMRLGIAKFLQNFKRVAVLSIQYTEDIDMALASVLRTIIPDLPIKPQVVLRMNDLVEKLQPEFQRLIEASTVILSQHPIDGKIASRVFASGVEAINALPHLAKTILDDTPMPESVTFDPVDLPPYEPITGSPSEIAEHITSYLRQPSFAGLDDVHLSASLLATSAKVGKPLPVTNLLTLLAYFVFAEVADHVVPLCIWISSHEVGKYEEEYVAAGRKGYIQVIDKTLEDVASAPNDNGLVVNADDDGFDSTRTPTKVATLAWTPNRPSSISQISPAGQRQVDGLPSRQGKTLKRARSRDVNSVDGWAEDEVGENTPKTRAAGIKRGGIAARGGESKVTKNARLLRALRDVESTLGVWESGWEEGGE